MNLLGLKLLVPLYWYIFFGRWKQNGLRESIEKRRFMHGENEFKRHRIVILLKEFFFVKHADNVFLLSKNNFLVKKIKL